MNSESTWQLIMATAEPVPMPAISATGRDVVRQLRAALWIHGKVRLTLNEIKTLAGKGE